MGLIIDSLLTTQYGDDWPQYTTPPPCPPCTSREARILEAQLKIARDERAFGRKAPWLSYTYPGDLMGDDSDGMNRF